MQWDKRLVDKKLTTERLSIFPRKWSYIQTYDDSKERGDKSLSRTFPLATGWYDKAVELSKKWASICFTVNITNWGRKKTDVEKIRCWVCEVDDVSKQAQMDRYISAPIPPSCIIESKNSYHAYWFAKDAEIDNYHLVTGWLRDYFFGDKSVVTDTSRVLRIPWFQHQKNKDDPFMIRLEYCFPECVYSEQEMMEAYPLNEVVVKNNNYISPTSGGIWDIISSWDNRSMLDDISWTGLMNWESIDFKQNSDGTQQIIVNWQSTGCWIDTSWMIGSSKWWWPTWIQWVMFYHNVSKSWLLRWVLERYKDRLPVETYNKEQSRIQAEKQQARETINQNFHHISYNEKLVRSANELLKTNPRDVIKRWWREFDYHLWGIYWGRIYLVGAETWTWKTTFVNIVCANIAKQWHQVVRYSLEDRLEDKGKEDLYYEVNKIRASDWKYPYIYTEFYNNEYWHKEGKSYDPEFESYLQRGIKSLSRLKITELDKTKQVNISELEILIKEEAIKGTRVFFIDHLHYFEMTNTERRDLEIQNVMQRLNDVVRNYNLTVFLVAHYSNTKWVDWKPHPWMFKDWASIKQVANIIIQLKSDRETGAIEVYFTKLRGGHRVEWWVIYWQFNIHSYDYTFDKTIEQQSHEKKFDSLWLL